MTRKNQGTSGKTKRDAYLRRKFSITEEEYNKALKKNGGVCAISGKPPTNRSLAVDHDHKIERWKIVSVKEGDNWVSSPQNTEDQKAPMRLRFTESDRLKQISRAKVKARLKRLSIRGVLDWQPNTGLRKWNDDPVLLRNAAQYLENYQRFLAEESNWRNGFEGE